MSAMIRDQSKEATGSDRHFYEREAGRYSLDAYWNLGFGRNIHRARCSVVSSFLLDGSNNDTTTPVIDLGCGEGTVTIWMAKHFGLRVIGCDISRARVLRASTQVKRHHLSSRVEFVVCDATFLPFQKDSLERVFSSEVLEHIPSDDTVLEQVQKVLSPRGVFVLGVPQEGSVLSKLRYKFWSPRLSRPFGGGFDIGHRNEYMLRTILRKVTGNGFRVTRFRSIGMILPFIPLHYLVLKNGPLFQIADSIGQRFPALGDMVVFRLTKIQKN